MNQSHLNQFEIRVNRWLKKNPRVAHFVRTKELHLLAFFGVLIGILCMRLFRLQIVSGNEYEKTLSNQHLSSSTLKAKRWSIYALDKSWKPMKLTENIQLFNVFIDPKFIPDKAAAIRLLTPIIYKHLCQLYEISTIPPTSRECVEHIQEFTQQDLLPKEPEWFYVGSGWWLTWDVFSSRSGYVREVQSVLSWFTQQQAYDLISQRLDQRIFIGMKEKNYLWFIEDKEVVQKLLQLWNPYISVEIDNYVYVSPSLVPNVSSALATISQYLSANGYPLSTDQLRPVFIPQENRYVRLIKNLNPLIAKEIRSLKEQYFSVLTGAGKEKIPLLHGLGLEETTRRYYPYGTFMSHILGFVDEQWQPYYGIEAYFDRQLRGADGKIVGRSSPRVGQVWSNEIDIQQVVDGDDIVLTIDPSIQREVETLTQQYQQEFRADSVSVIVMDPFTGHVVAMTNYPTFDPNKYNQSYDIQPLWPEYSYLLGDDTYFDIPIWIETWWSLKLATSDERNDPQYRKRIAKNIIGPQVFVDKNIAFPYEPGSIFKAFTVGIGLDNDEISLYDFYQDDMSIKIWPYTIANVDRLCKGYHTFLHALQFSCNVGMVRIVQRIGKEVFYNYVQKLGFGQLTNIELAGEEPGFVEDVNTVSAARFLNNSFGQGLLATPLQIAAWYASLINGGTYVKPTIVRSMYSVARDENLSNPKKIIRQIFKPWLSEQIKEALFRVVDNTVIKKFSYIPGFSLGWKSWTSQIAFKGKYQRGIGWTNGSFVGIVTRDNLRYVIVVQVRRPRSNQWWEATAGKLFQQIAKFLISYDLIQR